VARERPLLLAGLGIPELDGAVVAGGGDAIAFANTLSRSPAADELQTDVILNRHRTFLSGR
jgi:hypothetical protein